MDTPNEIFEDNKKKLEAFQLVQQKESQDEEKVFELAAIKLAEKILDKNAFFKSAEFENELSDMIKNISAKNIIDRQLSLMSCPLLLNPKWPFCDGCKKGEEEWCQGGKFTDCPAFGKYQSHQLVHGVKRKSTKKKE